MSAFGGKADMPFALHMSAFDPKRTWPFRDVSFGRYDANCSAR